jgi:hypothetical protein
MSLAANAGSGETEMDNDVRSFRDYRLLPVWQVVTPSVRERVCAFWLQERALPDRPTAERRAAELVYLIETATGELAGVTTAYAATAPRLGKPFYFYRTFVAARHRRPRLPQFMLQATYDLLRERCPSDGPRGMMVAAENRKLTRRGTRRDFDRLGWRYLGLTPRGQHTWIRPF